MVVIASLSGVPSLLVVAFGVTLPFLMCLWTLCVSPKDNYDGIWGTLDNQIDRISRLLITATKTLLPR